MKLRIPTLVGAVALGSTLLFASVGSAGAVTTAGPAGKGVCAVEAAAVKAGVSVEKLQAFGNCEINRRFDTLTKLTAKITASKVMTSSDKATLNGEISTTHAGLSELKTIIDNETSIPALRLDITKIATQFRVYLLVVPQVHLTNAADGVLATQAKFATINTNLSARIAAAKAAGKDTTAAQADLDAMNAADAAAIALASPIPGEILPLTPAQYNSGTAGPVLTAARANLVKAAADVKAAVADAKACRAALKALV
jgi:hypothetical protein